MERLFDALTEQNEDIRKNGFLGICHNLFWKTATFDDHIFLWQSIISELRRYLVPHIADCRVLVKVEDLFHQVRVMINEKAMEKEHHFYHESLHSNLVLNSINEVLYTNLDLQALLDVLAEKVPQMGISACYIDRFLAEDTEHGERKLVMAYNRRGLIDVETVPVYAGKHPKVAYDILKNLKFPWPLTEIILQHHERLGGSGYPNGLKGGEICLEARILAVADVIEAMASHRPYRLALGLDAAIMEIDKNRGVLYDPDVVDACKALFL